MSRNDPAATFGNLLAGRPHGRPLPQMQGPQEGRIIGVDEDAATCTFVIKDFDEEVHRFGPAPYGRTDTPPEVNDRCLAVFIGVGIDRPWVTAWQAPS